MMNPPVMFVRKSLNFCCWGRQYVHVPSWSILWSWGRGTFHTLCQRTFSLTGGWGRWWSGPVAALPPERSRLLFSQSPPRSHMVYCSAWRYRWSERRHTGQSGNMKPRDRERERESEINWWLTFRVPGPPSKTTHTTGMVTPLSGG